MKEINKDYVQHQSGVYGDSIWRKFKTTKKIFKSEKEKLKKKGIYMLPVKAIQKPHKDKQGDDYQGLQTCIAYLSQTEQENLMELAKNIPNPNVLIDQTIAIQSYRVSKGIKEEEECNRLLETTETAIQNLVSMINIKKTIEEGLEVNINVDNSISSILEEIEREENLIDID